MARVKSRIVNGGRGARWAFARDLWPGAALALLILAVAIGGGGSRYALSNLAIQICAIGVIAFRSRDASFGYTDWPVGLKALVAASLLLPLIHLVPLPSGLWHELPGRSVAVESRTMVGVANDWFPLSLDRGRTVLAFAALLPPLAILLLLPREATAQIIIRVILALVLANLILGGIQITANSGVPYGYPILEKGRIYGFFANHNTSGLFFVIGLCLLPAAHFRMGKLKQDQGKFDLAVKAGLAMLFCIGVILTQSRSSTALMLAVLVLILLSTVRKSVAGGRRIGKWHILLPSAALALLVAFGITNDRIGQTIDRFSDLDDQRYSIWADTLVGIERFFPFGSGMGSFDEVFQNFESLETLVPALARRAHNDYLEIGLEAGLLGLALVAAWLLWGAWVFWRKRGNAMAPQVNAAALALASIAAQSCVDYPLRNQAILCVAAVLISLLILRPIKTSTKP